MKGVLAAIVVMTCVAWCAGARAQVYRCMTSGGSVAYQDRPCAQGQRQTVVDVPSRAPPGDVPPPVATVATPPAADANAASPAVYVPPPSPLPVMYACVGAVNGKRYLTRSPPPPYLAPLGAMGWPPQTLSRAYGAPGGAGMSAPELSKPRIGGPRIAAGMTEVEDSCAPAPQAEVCAFVQREYDDNHRKLRMAVLPREQEPLQQREQELQDQLRNCR
ncbi:MAG: DUF4124 domain-containing protein [Xanthomonadales bacterium]|nr:DUF4124 domain-containing protein [Xanthomonadales bacterium]ODU94280.1 MAG: hypothetical protein ABT18_03850 [Rhodanobacter sp. SCN 66-43]OJY86887.1 MAG: hypothetical protein BGP23_11985 [Xanthomonadales bacterium 66-474]